MVSKSCSYAYKKFVKKKILFRSDLVNPIALIGIRIRLVGSLGYDKKTIENQPE